jgi:hypothetical protein
MLKTIIKYGAVHAGLTTAYVIGIASFLSHVEAIFGPEESRAKILIPVVMLLAFIISAAVTSLLVFGRPIMWYLEGKKKESLSLLACTLGFLLLILIILISII